MCSLRRQAATFLQWSQAICGDAGRRGRAVLVVNLDETAVARVVAHRRGHVVVRRCPEASSAGHYERISRRESHGHITVMGAVCSDATLQPLLTQWLLPKDAQMTRAEKAVLAALAPPLRWLRGTTGWVNDASLCTILTDLRRTVRAARPDCDLVVVWDAACQHLAAAVLAHARRLRVRLLLVPGRLTWLLQPLDTHVFALFKRTMHETQLQCRAEAPDGTLPPTQWLRIVETAIRKVLVERTWSASLRANGLTGDTAALRPRISRALGCQLPLPLRAPSEDEICQLLGRRRAGVAAHLTWQLEPQLALPAVAAAAGGEDLPLPPLPPPAWPPAAPAAAEAAAPIASRTRSRTRLAAAAAAAAPH